jgi:protein-L-isoaspartate(D-aspartate) O-methyltransferase
MRDLDAQKEQMIRVHLQGRGIRDPAVLSAMREVPREAFIPAGMRDAAYDDHPLPIDEGQTISQPYIVAYMLEALELTPDDRALEIGTGSGYAAAVLSRIVKSVVSVERLAGLSRSARRRLETLGYTNIEVCEGDGTLGWPQQEPYDAIVVTAGAPEVPAPLLQQLAVGGRLVIPVGASSYEQILIRVRRRGDDDYSTESLCGVRFVPLIGNAGWHEGMH